ncbi:Glycoside hydrolase 16 [Gracilaria domingensis]|nr:Glycoside hydrolase 16 [Gracilaria domingensis]
MNLLHTFPPKWKDTGDCPAVMPLPEMKEVPNLVNGHKDLPPSYILEQAPENMEWVKKYNFSSEFNTESEHEIVPMKQLSRWTTDNHWKGRFPAMFDGNNVTFDGNSMILKACPHTTPTSGFLQVFGEKKRTAIDERLRAAQRFYTGSFVRSKSTITYGYFETMVKLGDCGLSSAFWLKERGGREREIDVFEYSTSANRDEARRRPLAHQFLMNLHSFERRGKLCTDHDHSRSVNVDADLSKQDLKVGLLWTSTQICWYLNDTLVRECDHAGEFRNAKMRVQFDREYFNWLGDPCDGDAYGDFEVKYIRTWQL